MAVFEICALKSTHTSVIDSVLSDRNVEAWGCLNIPSDQTGGINKPCEVMENTYSLFHDLEKRDANKLFMFKTRFSPNDLAEVGGPLTVELAGRFASTYASQHWPDREVLWAVCSHLYGRHIYFFVNSPDLQTGRKLRVSRDTWRQWKDDCQTLCRQYGLHYFSDPLSRDTEGI